MQLSKSKAVIGGLFCIAFMPFSVYSLSTTNKVTCYVHTGPGGFFYNTKCDVFNSCTLVTNTQAFDKGASCQVTATPFDSVGPNGTKTITAEECQNLIDTYSSCPGYVLHQR